MSKLYMPDYYKTALNICGVDEAGRGPLAGPVVAAAVILDPNNPIEGLGDSKKISEKKRLLLYPLIQQHAISWAIAQASAAEIDDINILQASLLAMKRAIEKLHIKASHALIDGNKAPDLNISCTCIIKGDEKETCIGAASILAKVYRDELLIKMDEEYPQYQFAKHKGYPTKLHRELLIKHGACKEHRRSFKPVKEALLRQGIS